MMNIKHSLLILALLASQALAGDLTFTQEEGKTASAEGMAMDFSSIYKLTWNADDVLSAKLSACNNRLPYKTEGIEFPQIYQGGIRLAQGQDRESLILGADLVLHDRMIPGFSLTSEYWIEKAVAFKAGYSPDRESKLQVGLGFTRGKVNLEYIYENDRDMHRFGFVTRLG